MPCLTPACRPRPRHSRQVLWQRSGGAGQAALPRRLRGGGRGGGRSAGCAGEAGLAAAACGGCHPYAQLGAACAFSSASSLPAALRAPSCLALCCGVQGLAVGQPVATMTYGGFAEFAVVASKHVLQVPAASPEMVALMTSGLTASIALEQAGLVRRLLVPGASGERWGRAAAACGAAVCAAVPACCRARACGHTKPGLLPLPRSLFSARARPCWSPRRRAARASWRCSWRCWPGATSSAPAAAATRPSC